MSLLGVFCNANFFITKSQDMKIYLWAKWVVFNGPYSCLRVSIKFQNQVSFVNLLLCTCTLSEWIVFILNCLVKLFKNNFHNLRIKFVVVCLWLNDCAFFQSQTAEEELAQASTAFQKQQEINTQHTQKVSVVFEKADSLKVIFSFSLIFFWCLKAISTFISTRETPSGTFIMLVKRTQKSTAVDENLWNVRVNRIHLAW